MNYPYRFKTKKEFEKEFGPYWEQRVKYMWNSPYMDPLFGQEFPYTLDELDIYDQERLLEDVYRSKDGLTCNVSWQMLTKNEPKTPNYKPKSKRILESVNDKKKYNILCNTRDGGIELEDFLHKNGYTWDNTKRSTYILHKYDIPDIIFCDVNFNEKTFSGFDYDSIKRDSQWLDKYGEIEILNYPEDKIKITNIIKYGDDVPNYKPKKRVLESIDHTEKEILLHITNEESNIKIQNFLFSIGYSWTSGSITPSYTNNLNMVLVIEILYKSLSYHNDFDRFKRYNKDKVYELSDWYMIQNFLKYGGMPNYSPKKKRILESFENKSNMDYIDIYIDNKKDAEKIQKLLFQYDIYWCDGFKDIWIPFSFPIWLSIDLNNPDFSFSELEEDMSGKKFTMNDYDDIEILFKYGNFKPNYKPKKFLKESVNNYDSIAIEIPNEEESKKYQSLLFQYGFIWCDGQKVYYDVGHYPIWFSVELNKHSFSIVYEGNIEYEKNIMSNEDYVKIVSILKYGQITPSYKPKKFLKESVNNKVLRVFDLDDTLVYSKRFEEHVKPLLTEFLNPEIILKSKIHDIGINIEDLKYENGRIFFEDPEQLTYIPNNSSWVRKKDRVYITQPDAYFMTEESMPIGTYPEIEKIYEESEYKAIITARNERLREQTELALKNLGIKMPNCGLFMYPENNFSLKVRWKIDKIIELIHNENFTEVHYFDDNIKILKKMKEYFDKENVNVILYKVTENKYRKI